MITEVDYAGLLAAGYCNQVPLDCPYPEMKEIFKKSRIIWVFFSFFPIILLLCIFFRLVKNSWLLFTMVRFV